MYFDNGIVVELIIQMRQLTVVLRATHPFVFAHFLTNPRSTIACSTIAHLRTILGSFDDGSTMARSMMV